MRPHSVHEALAQIRTLQTFILEKQLFRGFSGRARIASGLTALAGAGLLSGGWIPRTPTAHLVVWGSVLAIALVLNFGALAVAFFVQPSLQREPARFRPVADIVPPLAIGAFLSVALVRVGQYDLLFGTWMMLYGLAHLSVRRALPPAIVIVGLFYFACGALNLLWTGRSFLNPWPMALAFLPGEWAGGIILSSIQHRSLSRGNDSGDNSP